MNIVIATPTYPPEVNEQVLYVQELASRLGAEHRVTVVAYTNQANPGSIPKTTLVSVKKQHPLFVRLFLYIRALFRASKDADCIYVQEIFASGLPAAVVSLVKRTPIIVAVSVDEAQQRLARKDSIVKKLYTTLYTLLQHFVLGIAKAHSVTSKQLQKTLQLTGNAKTILAPFPVLQDIELPFSVKKHNKHVFISNEFSHKTTQYIERFLKNVLEGDSEITVTLLDFSGCLLGSQLSQNPRVIIKTVISKAEQKYLLQESVLHVYCNQTSENFNLAVTGLQMGKPTVVLSDSVEIPNYQYAYTLSEEQVAASKIATWVNDQSVLQSMSQTAQNLYDTMYSWEQHIQKITTVFERVSKKKNNESYQ